MQSVYLLRWSQASLVLCGLILIAIGCGLRVPGLPALFSVAITGAIAGVIYEGQLWRRGESQEWLPVVLPIVGGLSGTLAWLSNGV